MQHRYSLEKGSEKHICPQCKQKTFVRFVDNQNCTYLSDDVGRCDREQKCRYFKGPNEFHIEQKSLTNSFSYFPLDKFMSTLNDYNENTFVTGLVYQEMLSDML